MGLGCNWTNHSIGYAIALKHGIIADADFEIDLPDKWHVVKGKMEQLIELVQRIKSFLMILKQYILLLYKMELI